VKSIRPYRVMRRGLLAACAIVLSAIPLMAQTVPLVGNHPNIESSRIQGPLDGQQQLTLDMVLALRNRAALEKLKAEQQDPTSPNYRHWLTPDEFNARFGPSPSDFKAASDWLSAQGFTIVESNPAARYIRFSGPVALVESTFGAGLVSMGGDRFANTQDPRIPERFQNVIGSIQGLDNLHAARALKKKSLLARGSATAPRAAAENLRLALSMDAGAAESEFAAQPETINGGITAFAPSDLYTFYDVTPILNSGIKGGGCIAIAGDSDYLHSAVTLFNTTFSMPPETITTVLSSNKSGTFTNPGVTSDESEALLDLEWSHATAPGVTINFYLGDENNSTNGSIPDAIQKAVNDNACSVISVSFELCGYPNSFFTATFDPIVAQAASQGQSIFISSGDEGAAGLVFNGSECVTATSRHVNEMSADTNVTSVGGTSFNPNFDGSGNDTSTVNDGISVVWEGSSGRPPTANTGATGGGASAVFSKPSYQIGLTPSDGARDVPDVALLADPGAPGVFLGDDPNQSGTATIDCCWGGTSLSAPVFAGFTKLIEQKVGQRLGNINTKLYQLASSNGSSHGVRDITSGINTFNSVTGFAAGPGYNQSSGWGEVDANQFLTAFTPVASVTVTSSGSGTASAGQVNVAAGMFTATNTSASAETITSVTVAVSHPTLFASMTLTGTSPDTVGTASATATPPTASQALTLSIPLTVNPGHSASFSLTMTISMTPAMLERNVAYAGMIGPVDTGNGLGPLAAGLSILGLGMMVLPAVNRRRAWLVLIAAIALAATQVGCGSGGGGGSTSTAIASTQTVTAIAATSAGGAVTFSGLPAPLGTTTVP